MRFQIKKSNEKPYKQCYEWYCLSSEKPDVLEFVTARGEYRLDNPFPKDPCPHSDDKDATCEMRFCLFTWVQYVNSDAFRKYEWNPVKRVWMNALARPVRDNPHCHFGIGYCCYDNVCDDLIDWMNTTEPIHDAIQNEQDKAELVKLCKEIS